MTAVYPIRVLSQHRRLERCGEFIRCGPRFDVQMFECLTAKHSAATLA